MNHGEKYLAHTSVVRDASPATQTALFSLSAALLVVLLAGLAQATLLAVGRAQQLLA